LNINTTFNGFTFLAESGGVAESNTGGILSIGPPEGGIILAQPPVASRSIDTITP
jgi:hypothetical protein